MNVTSCSEDDEDARDGDIYTNGSVQTLCVMTMFVLCFLSVSVADDLLTHSHIHGGHCIFQPPVPLCRFPSLSLLFSLFSAPGMTRKIYRE